MGRASSSKKVARAASTGGGRTARGRTPWGWYTGVAVMLILGVFLVGASRSDRQQRLSATSGERPRPGPQAEGGDHWHAAYGIYICDSFLPNIQSDRDPLGIHTHGDGVIHIHPFTSAASGKKATLGVFAEAVGITLKKGEIKAPGGKTFKDGDKCNGKPAVLQVSVDGKVVTGDPTAIRFTKDRQLITMAFVPKGTKVPKPPSEPKLDDLDDVPGSGSDPSIPITPSESTTPPSDPATNPPSSTATTAGR